MEPKKILIVANQTAPGPAIRAEVRRRMEEGPCEFTLLVPATALRGHVVWTDQEAYDVAHRRMEYALGLLRGMGAIVVGEVGDESPFGAIGDALRRKPHDEIILSTLPPGVSRWLKSDLPHRVEREYELPVTTVIASKEHASIG